MESDQGQGFAGLVGSGGGGGGAAAGDPVAPVALGVCAMALHAVGPAAVAAAVLPDCRASLKRHSGRRG